jgi:alpha 1,3-glucosidase
VYYDYFTSRAYHGSKKGKHVTVPSALHQIPLLLRGGSIVPTRERPRRSSALMHHDPFTLRVALDQGGRARGELYLDDGETYAHLTGEIVWREFSAERTGYALSLASADLVTRRPAEAVDGVALSGYDPSKNTFARRMGDVRVERIVVVGVKSAPKSVVVKGGDAVEWEYVPGVGCSDGKGGVAGILIVKNPRVKIVKDWAILAQF